MPPYGTTTRTGTRQLTPWWVTNSISPEMTCAGPAPFGEIMNIWVQDPLVYYSPDPAGYLSMGLLPTDDDDHLRAYKGYWMYSFVPNLRMVVPPPQ